MDWISVGKIALSVFLAVSVAYVVVVYVRRAGLPRRGRPVRPDPNPFHTGRWAFAPTPLPDWAYLDDDSGDTPEADR